MARIRILLVDDNDAVVAELCRELEHEFEIVGTACNGQDAVDYVARLNPDIVVLDIVMPVLNGAQGRQYKHLLCVMRSVVA